MLALVLTPLACSPPAGAGPPAGPAPPPSRTAARSPTRATAPLTRVEVDAVPDLRGALAGERESLLQALDRSLDWFAKPSSRDHFPLQGISHAHAEASVAVFKELLVRGMSVTELERRLLEEFDFFAVGGVDGFGNVLFTGYYSPAFEGSLRPGGEYRYPLYRAPDDLVVDERTGAVAGQWVGGEIRPYPTRAEIERSGMLAGLELVWLRDSFEAYLMHVQGSGAVRLPDGTTLYLGYAGNNGHEYVSVARELVAEGRLREDELSLDEVRAFFDAHSEETEAYLQRNPRYVFFRTEEPGRWPLGSLGVPVTPLRSLATDKQLFPRGGVVLVMTETPASGAGKRRLERFMLDQDAGGAITTAGRADIYFGYSDEAEDLAGRQYAEGRLYYLFLKPDRLGAWEGRSVRD
ncbi:MAG: MltA domain-containing protein [Gemmatimonadota bacterium]|nr:MAG: MltA domain-containing protein [Gemmatimonadota bacterium]